MLSPGHDLNCYTIKCLTACHMNEYLPTNAWRSNALESNVDPDELNWMMNHTNWPSMIDDITDNHKPLTQEFDKVWNLTKFEPSVWLSDKFVPGYTLLFHFASKN